jgi:Fe-S-cluster-containing hydrogenase component 2
VPKQPAQPNPTPRPAIPARLAEHPSVRAVLADRADNPRPTGPVDAAWLREVCLAAGADDAAAVSVDHPDLTGEREHVRSALPGTRTLVSLVVRMNRDDVRSPARSVANQEFHRAGEIINDAARTIVQRLQDEGHRALNPSATFPMEMDRFPGQIWVVAHKTVAVAAGMGAMGIHRNVIHPRFGNFVLLATVLLDAEVSGHGSELDYNPCLECKLCVAACPVGAIGKAGEFDFRACSAHNYREFMGGFTDWVETIADSTDREDFQSRVTASENASMWQSLSFKPNYKAAYCMAVCPAGEDVLGPYLDDRKQFMATVLRPLQDKVETIYVTPGSPAGDYTRRRFPHKPVREVGDGRRDPRD